MLAPLTPAQLGLLVEIRRADEEAGGLFVDTLSDDEKSDLGALTEHDFVELRSDDDGSSWARVTWRGAERVRELGPLD